MQSLIMKMFIRQKLIIWQGMIMQGMIRQRQRLHIGVTKLVFACEIRSSVITAVHIHLSQASRFKVVNFCNYQLLQPMDKKINTNNGLTLIAGYLQPNHHPKHISISQFMATTTWQLLAGKTGTAVIK